MNINIRKLVWSLLSNERVSNFKSDINFYHLDSHSFNIKFTKAIPIMGYESEPAEVEIKPKNHENEYIKFKLQVESLGELQKILNEILESSKEG